MSKSFTTVKSLLPSLSPAEISQVRAMLELLDKSNSKRTANGSATADSLEFLFYKELAGALLDFGIKMPPIAVVKRGRLHRPYKEGKEVIEDFLEEAAKPGRLTRIQRTKVYRLVFGMLLRWMRNRGIPVTLNSALNNLDKIPQLLMQEFPGYVETGLLLRLVATL